MASSCQRTVTGSPGPNALARARARRVLAADDQLARLIGLHPVLGLVAEIGALVDPSRDRRVQPGAVAASLAGADLEALGPDRDGDGRPTAGSAVAVGHPAAERRGRDRVRTVATGLSPSTADDRPGHEVGRCR